MTNSTTSGQSSLLNNQVKTKDDFKRLVETLTAQHSDLREKALLFALSFPGSTPNDSTWVASMVGEGKFGTLHILYEALNRPDYSGAGFVERNLDADTLNSLISIFAPYHASSAEHPNVAFLLKAKESNQTVSCTLINRACTDSKLGEAYTQFKTTLLFSLFNEGALRGSDSAARQALLDAFSILPNRYLTSDGQFTLLESEEPNFIRRVPSYSEFASDPSRLAPGGIDKFPSLLSVRAERLKADGNRVIPSAMIRDGVYVGKRNIFMFHSAINIAAFIGDDNLIDSHASVGSAAQVGNKNKIGSFVSLEGVISPANAQGVTIGNENFLGTFTRIGTGISLGDKNFIGAGVNISLGTKLKDCRSGSETKGNYISVKELANSFNNLAIAPNNANRDFEGVSLVPGEYILFENSADFMSRFEGDSRIRAKT